MTDNELLALVAEVADFPKPDISFKDITPVLNHREAFGHVIERFSAILDRNPSDALVAIESRGFIFGAALAARRGIPLVLARKQGKLPRHVAAEDYELEYGTDRIEVHADDIEPGKRYAVIDDLIASGGTAGATIRLVERLGGVVSCAAFFIELASLDGRAQLNGTPVESIITYEKG